MKKTEGDRSPILIVPLMWIGDFVRIQPLAAVLAERFPGRQVDVLATKLTAPLTKFMPGVRKAVLSDIPRKKVAWGKNRELANLLRAEGYGTALIMPRKWKAALAPYLAGIPERVGVWGEWRWPLVNSLRKELPEDASFIAQACSLAFANGEALPEFPQPKFAVPAELRDEWRARMNIVDGKRAVVFAPGSAGESKRWPPSYFAEAAKRLTAQGVEVWVVGGPEEKPFGKEIAEGNTGVCDFTGAALADGVIAVNEAEATLANDSGLLHIAVALGKKALGIFGPTDPDAALALANPAPEIILRGPLLDCQYCWEYVCPLQHHKCMRDIAPERVADALMKEVRV